MRPWYRIHFSTLFVLAIVAAALVFINVPGDRMEIVSKRFYHGWPYHYFDREGSEHSFWTFAGTAPRFHAKGLLLNVLTALCLAALAAFACELWIRRNGRLLRFGTRSLLVATALVAALVGLVARDVRRSSRQQQTLQELAQFGHLDIDRDLRKLDWFRSLFGDHFHGAVWSVSISADRPMNRLPDLTPLDGVVNFGLHTESIPENIGQIADLPKLKYLGVTLTSLAATDRPRLAALTEIPQLCALGLVGDDFDDGAVLLISPDAQLEALSIVSPKVTVKGLSHLAHLKLLSNLTLEQTVIQNQDCSALLQSPRLSHLNFIGNNITAQDADKAQKLWPAARVIAGTSAMTPWGGVWKPSLRIFRESGWLNSP